MKTILFLLAMLFGNISCAQEVLANMMSFNLGLDVSDYWHLWQMPGAPFYEKPVSFEEFREITEKRYPAIEWSTAIRLLPGYDVLMLKNVGRMERPFMVVAREMGFSPYKFSRRSSRFFDTSILLGETFEFLENHSFFHHSSLRDATIVKARHKATKLVFTFVSIHVPGENNNRTTLSDLELGDSYCKEVARRLKSIAKRSFLVIGADMGANQFQNFSRFKHLSNLGIEIFGGAEATRFDSLEGSDEQPFNIVDYFFVSKSVHARRKSIKYLKGKEILRCSAGVANDVWKYVDFNFSSHAPVYLTYYYEPKHLKRIVPPSSY